MHAFLSYHKRPAWMKKTPLLFLPVFREATQLAEWQRLNTTWSWSRETYVCQWLSETLQSDITPQTFIERLNTGVVLCQLVELVQEKARALEENEVEVCCRVPLEPIKYRPGAGKTTFHARENTKHFLDWWRELGIQDDLIFETNGLVEHADEKRVLLCLLEVSRYAKKVHIKPPDIIRKEQESSETEREEMTNPANDEVITFLMQLSQKLKITCRKWETQLSFNHQRLMNCQVIKPLLMSTWVVTLLF